jgi:subtilisin family serine protease
VVGVADTGLDENSCYFYDSSGSVKKGLVTSPITDFKRRKVVQYSRMKETDTSDLTAGHGSHAAGTVAGYNQQPLSGGGKYSGVAPTAKIAFFDLADKSGSLYIPPVTQHYTAFRQAKALVCSNSWGGAFSKKGGYYANGEVDKYLYKNMDTLIVFANANSGMDGLGTVSREASSKNVLSVG